MIVKAPLHRLAAVCLCLLLAAATAAVAEPAPEESGPTASPDPVFQRALDELARVERLINSHERRSTGALDEEAQRLIEGRLDYLRQLAELVTAAAPNSEPTAARPGANDLSIRIESLSDRLRRGPKGHSTRTRMLPTAGPIPAAPPANDTCATATPIGEGTFLGDTTEAGSDGDATCGDSSSSPDAWFAYTPSASGTAFFNTFGSDYDTVLSVHSACPGTTGNEIDCNDDADDVQSEVVTAVTSGTTVYVRVSGWDGDAGPFILNVGLPGSISGTLTEAGSGDPITGLGASVTAYRVVDGDTEFGGSDATDAGGNYTIDDLAPGTYRVIAHGPTQVNELYDDISCPGGINSCFEYRGADVVVTGGSDTSGIDFVLDPGGSISGMLTRESDGTPVSGPGVQVFDLSGNRLLNEIAVGSYSIAGLPTGEYYLATDFAFPLADLVYPDLPCPGGSASQACSPRTGTRVSVTAPADTPGIDFVLPDGGSITGTVTEDGSGDFLEDISVRLSDANGASMDLDSSESNGTYSFTGLHSGSYRVITRFTDDHLDELYDDIVCYNGPPNGCSVPDGDPVAVTAPAETSGIDIALGMGGSISGAVTEDPSGTPLADVDVEVYDATGDVFLAVTSTAGDGSFLVEGLPSGSFRVQTFGAATHADELYDDLPCPGGYCDVAPGDPVAVTAPSDTSGIDFALAAAGAISGTVTESGTGTPLGGIDVEAYNAAGDFSGFSVTAADGTYTLDALPTGSYYVTTAYAPGHVDELYDNVVCPAGGSYGCDPTTGSSVAVTAPSTTSGIDFALSTGGLVEGTVTDAVMGLPARTTVTIFNAAGLPLYEALADGAGHYVSIGLPTGTYYASTDTLDGFLERRFGGLSCVGSCDPELSSPITVTSPSTTMGVDIMLYKPGADDALVLSHEDLDADASFCSEGTITLGPDFGLVGSAGLEVLAAGSVVFESGFSAAAGTTLEVGVDGAATCP